MSNATIGNQTVVYSSRGTPLIAGWVPQPNTRGTMDILWGSVFTIILSSWSILCLNIPAKGDNLTKRTIRKTLWTFFVIFGPEAVLQQALTEFFEARKIRKLMVVETKLAKPDSWTMSHSFYAMMGGFVLKAPDFEEFPINVYQLKYLVEQGHLEMPTITRAEIVDRDKADLFVRAVTGFQVIWFLLNSIARLAQGLALTSLELTTLAFISSALGIFFFWFHKPMDIETKTHLETKTTIRSLQEVHNRTDADWISSPLEFLDPPMRQQWVWNLYWHHTTTMVQKCLPWFYAKDGHKASSVPRGVLLKRVPNDMYSIPEVKSVPVSFAWHFTYAVILVAGWNLQLPTYIELLLWRIATVAQLAMLTFLWCTMPLVISSQYGGFQEIAKKPREKLRTWYRGPRLKDFELPKWRVVNRMRDGADRARTAVNDHPAWRVSLRILLMYYPLWPVYAITRMYIIGEDLASLRAAPVSAYTEVDWSIYLPHI